AEGQQRCGGGLGDDLLGGDDQRGRPVGGPAVPAGGDGAAAGVVGTAVAEAAGFALAGGKAGAEGDAGGANAADVVADEGEQAVGGGGVGVGVAAGGGRIGDREGLAGEDGPVAVPIDGQIVFGPVD